MLVPSLRGRRSGSPDITPAMIEAGVSELWNSFAVEHPMGADREVIRRIFVAMTRAAHP